jgi:hypothetical protein
MRQLCAFLLCLSALNKEVFFINDAICIVNNIDKINKVGSKKDYNNVSVEAKR